MTTTEPTPTGAQLRDQGVSDVLAAATSAIRDYRTDVECVLDELAATGRAFTADHVQKRLRALHGDTWHPSPNVVSAMFSSYAGHGWITCVGYDTSKRPGRHAGLLRIWRGTDHLAVEAVAA